MKKCILLLLLVFWMGIIFAFSAQPAEESGKISDSVCYRAVSGASHLLRLEWTKEQMEAYAVRLVFPVRKAAHMTEYAILAILAWGNLTAWKRKSDMHNYVYAFLFAILYAMTDEFHQTFVNGRSGNWTDVCIDGAGAFLGIICIAAISCRGGRKHRKIRGSAR